MVLLCRELEIALELNGVSASEDMEMVAKIKAEVRKLSNRTDIYRSICELEEEEQLKENKDRMIYVPRSPKTPRATQQQVRVSSLHGVGDLLMLIYIE